MTHSRTIRHLALLSVSALAVAFATAAQAEERQFDLAAQAPATAIQEFARQANLQILVPQSELPNMQLNAVRGRYDTRVALERLIENTGLGIVSASGNTVVLGPVAKPVSAPKPTVRAEKIALQAGDGYPPPAAAAAPAGPAPGPAVQAPNALEEVVVTATRQVDTVNRVALSISAVTQKTLDNQSIKTVNDLQRITPGLILTASVGLTGNSGDSTVSIRGVTANVGAATTGVYLDEIPLQKRTLGSPTTGNGSAYPKLFDLDRVEVLRGPQGTLYGGSSEGGTIRFITPQPSFTRFSSYARGELSHTEGGDWTYEAGVAGGGPIIQDKVAFRASAWDRHIGGYIDQVSRFTGNTLAWNTNSGDDSAFKLAVGLRPIEKLTITPTFYLQNEKRNDSDQFWENMPAYTSPAISSNALGKNCVATPAAPCAYVVPAHTYGPYNFYGPGKAGQVEIGPDGQEHVAKQPQIRQLNVDSIDFDYDLGFADAKFITSFIEDNVKGFVDSSYKAGIASNTGGININYLIPQYYDYNFYFQHRHGVTEEFRLTSHPSDSKLSWVGGVFYSNANTHAHVDTPASFDLIANFVRGVSTTTLFTVPELPGGNVYDVDQVIAESEVAGYGEANYQILPKLKATVGLRVSHDTLDYSQVQFGPNAGYNVPTQANGGLTSGSEKASPVTPKFSLSYQVTDHDLLYATVAKGYRVGGVNPQIPVQKCASDLQTLGLTTTPSTYGPDSVWSYETGAKLRLFGGRAQINTSAYYIDWTDLQTTLNLPTCSFSYTTNGGKAVSKGVDMQAQARFFGFTGTLGFGYDDAHYSQATYTPPNAVTGAKTLLITQGDPLLNTPKWTWSLGLQYDFQLMTRAAFVRGDYQYQDKAFRTFGPLTSGYQSDVYKTPINTLINMRAGINVTHELDMSLFVNNLLDSQTELWRYGGHAGPTRFTPQFFGTTLRPREIGITATYRH